MKKVLILGGGFAGLIAAERLCKFAGDKHHTTLVSPHRTFTFYPALIRLAFRELESKDITFDLTEKLDKLDVRFVEGKVSNIKPESNQVRVEGNDFSGDLSYDYLIIATGRSIATDKIPGFFEHARHLLGVEAAQNFGLAVDNFSQRKIVVGLAPNAELPVPVCETAFALANKFKDLIAEGQASVSVVFPESIKQAFGGANIHWELEKAFEKHKIKVITDFRVREVENNKLVSADRESIPFDLLMLIPPFEGHDFQLDEKYTNEFKLLEVDRFMSVKGLENVYAAGDITALPGPKLAHTAIGQAEVAAGNVLHEIEGRKPDEYYYHEIDAIIDQGGPDSIYLDYAMWDKATYALKRGRMWGYIKRLHNKIWRERHRSVFLDQGL